MTVEGSLLLVVLAGVTLIVAFMTFDAYSRWRWRRGQFALDMERYASLSRAAATKEDALAYDLSRRFHWRGFRKFVVVRKVMETPDIASFHLKPHDGKPLASCLPGQFLTVSLEAGGGAPAAPAVRCYTLSRALSDEDDEYRVTIKRLPPPPDAPPRTPRGLVSSHFVESIDEGSVLDVAQPSGKFTLDLAAGRPVAMLAGGIGITPFLSMAEYLERHQPDREAWIFYGTRRPEEQVGFDRLCRWAENPRFHFVPVYSAAGPPHRELREFEEAGHIGPDLLKRRLPSSNYEFFVCGPPRMVQPVIDGLIAWDVPRDSIHYEAFSAATARAAGLYEGRARRDPCRISFQGAGRELRWAPETGTVLECAEANGLGLPYGCRVGHCGTCATRVLRGSVTYLSEPQARVGDGHCLVCICTPDGDLELA